MSKKPAKAKPVTMRQALSDRALLGVCLPGESWRGWRCLLIATMGEALDDEERGALMALTGRVHEPGVRVEELWVIAGRRAGKSRAISVLLTYIAVLQDHSAKLVAGETPTVMCLAPTSKQASIVLSYVAGVFESTPLLTPLVVGKTTETLSLSNGVEIVVRAASFRGVRGVTCLAVVADEICYWRSEDSANPDKEIMLALRPSLATTSGLLCAISSPYGKRGAAYEAYQRHYGSQGDPLILVAKAASRDLNPSLPQKVVDRALAEDPDGAAAEYLGEWRTDVSDFLPREIVDASVVPGVVVIPPRPNVAYRAGADPSGGSSDSFTAAVAHLEGDTAVLDCLIEIRAPFDPKAATAQVAAMLREYGLSSVVGDRYSANWVVSEFASDGIRYEFSENDRSAIYLNALPLFTSGNVRLLDNRRLVSQLTQLERKTTALKEIVNHPPNGKDDASNSACLALGLAAHDRRPALVRQVDLLKDGEGFPLPQKAAWIAAVLMTDERGNGAIVYGGLDITLPIPPLLLLDFDVGPLSGSIFADTAARIGELMKACRASNAVVFVPEELQFHATAAGLPTEIIPEDFLPEERLLSVAAHVAAGSVKLCARALEKARGLPFAGALDLRAGEDVGDPLRAAAILLVALCLDSIGGRLAA